MAYGRSVNCLPKQGSAALKAAKTVFSSTRSLKRHMTCVNRRALNKIPRWQRVIRRWDLIV